MGVSGVGNNSYDAVSGSGDAAGSTGAYTLVLSPGIAGTMRRQNDTTDHLVDILRYGPDPWVPSSFMPTLPGRLFFLQGLAGPLEPEMN